MSIEFQPTASIATDDVGVPDDPADVFEQLVADASLCCQQCYRRIRARHNFSHQWGRDVGDILSFVDYELPEGEPEWNTTDREYHEEELLSERTVQANPPGDDLDSGSACANCGAVDAHRSPSTRSREEALQAAVGIIATLTEFGVAHDPLALIVEVGELKQNPDYAGDDFATFATAVARAVRSGRRPR
ncbi:hypothetical protein [Haloarcula pellucida]|uniref:Uncharacterized protein n=1 Tax=Haloarcula pellucida TaxID=1427151 RepID=A0A830GRR5_9EURY|nr:hypothetical protein [Halomicroarcula pellucida]MBX0350369.1 hypothetical protein [Halomicroarcula pellucida]GGO01726.1 hypothetical protein GCM10009030_35720 [Halomicroarcula pellucida]